MSILTLLMTTCRQVLPGQQQASAVVHWLCKGVGATLFISVLNIALLLCGALADSTDVVSAVIENPFIGPVTVASLGLLVACKAVFRAFRNAIFSELFRYMSARRAGVILSKSLLTHTVFAVSPRVRLSHGSRAPPLSFA
ncbi:hypothetical protein [Salinimonas chungwhensis]|uniref:hypothetical protein n=1 Tax=Salinimonas chungwhensis TaxID=265425 RepID=UPI00035FB0E3|nr:hypothetical protein [Salinimonas chungwhensis]